MQGKMLTLRVFTALANQTVAVLLIPVFSPLCTQNFHYTEKSSDGCPFDTHSESTVALLNTNKLWRTIALIYVEEG